MRLARLRAHLTCGVAAALVSVGLAAESPRLPITLEDPATGASTEVKPGPRALHVVFLATWCQPCIDELTKLSDLEARWGALGYDLVLVGVPARQTRERLAKFHEEKKLPGRLLFDAKGAASRALDVEILPKHFVFDSEGKLVRTSRSVSEGVEEAVSALLRKDGGRGGKTP